MLSTSAVYEAQQLTTLLGTYNLGAVAVPNSPLESLVRANMTAPMAIAINSVGAEEFAPLLLEGSKFRDHTGAVDHDLVQAEVIEVVAGVVAGNLDVAKNVVNPICLDVLARLDSTVQQAAAREINNIAVVPDFFGEVWNNPQLTNLTEMFETTAPTNIELRGIVPDISDEAVAELVVTGVSPLDQDVVAEFAKDNSALLGKVYREVFVRSKPSDRELSDILNPLASNRSQILAVFLLARRLSDDIPDGISISLADYRLYLANIMAQAGYAITRLQALRERAIKTRTLLRGFPFLPPAGEALVVVNGPVYNEWLKAGGTPEILLGSFITDGELDFDTLIAKGAEYTKAWNRHLAIKAQIVSDDRYSRIVAGLNAVMVAVIREQAADTNGPSKDQMFDALKTQLDMIHRKDIDDVAHLVQRVVCRVMFRHTDAESILNRMDYISGQYPDMEISEVTLLATIDHVATWVRKLVDIKSI